MGFKDALQRCCESVNGELISNFVLPKMQELVLHDMFSTRRCQMPYSTRNSGLIESVNILFHFRDRDRPLDYFLWGNVKAHVCTDKPASIDALQDNIEAFIREIPAEMLERVPLLVRKIK